MNCNKLNKVLSVLSYSYTAPTALGIRQDVEQIRAITFLFNVFKRFLFLEHFLQLWLKLHLGQNSCSTTSGADPLVRKRLGTPPGMQRRLGFTLHITWSCSCHALTADWRHWNNGKHTHAIIHQVQKHTLQHSSLECTYASQMFVRYFELLLLISLNYYCYSTTTTPTIIDVNCDHISNIITASITDSGTAVHNADIPPPSQSQAGIHGASSLQLAIAAVACSNNKYCSCERDDVRHLSNVLELLRVKSLHRLHAAVTVPCCLGWVHAEEKDSHTGESYFRHPTPTHRAGSPLAYHVPYSTARLILSLC